MPATPPPDVDEVVFGTGPDAISADVVTDEPFRFSNDRNGPRRLVTYQVEGSVAAVFCDLLLGVGTAISALGYPQPHRYPNNVALMCQAVDGVPVGYRRPDPQLMRGDLAWIQAEYAWPLWDVYGEQVGATLGVAPVPWSMVETVGGTEQIAVASDGLVTAGGTALPLDTKLTRDIGTCEYVFRRMMLPTMIDFDSVCKSLAGKVNDGTFFNCPRGTLKFESWSSRRGSDPSGSFVQEFGIVLRWREVEHNYVLVPETVAQWDYLQDAAGNRPYLYADFSPIIAFGS